MSAEKFAPCFRMLAVRSRFDGVPLENIADGRVGNVITDTVSSRGRCGVSAEIGAT